MTFKLKGNNMNSAKQKIQDLLTTLKSLKQKEDVQNDAFTKLTVALGGDPSFIIPGATAAFLRAVKILLGEEVYDDLEYYIYEAPYMKDPATVTPFYPKGYKGVKKKYDFRKDKEVIEYMYKYHKHLLNAK